MNLAAGACFIIVWFFYTHESNWSIDCRRLVQSWVLHCCTRPLNSSMSAGSIGFDIEVCRFLKLGW